eukprot:3044793-Pyramimonas_sp.AAC.1
MADGLSKFIDALGHVVAVVAFGFALFDSTRGFVRLAALTIGARQQVRVLRREVRRRQDVQNPLEEQD